MVVFRAQNSAHEVKELGIELHIVVGEDLRGDAVRVNPLLQKRSGNCRRCTIWKLDATCHHGRPVSYDRDEYILPCGLFSRVE